MNEIPVMDDPLGRHWRQPFDLRARVTIDDTHVLIDANDFLALPDYSTSLPSGVYPGKAWRAEERRRGDDGYVRPTGRWFLRWYGPDIAGRCAVETREALFA